jgi:hypothetical protein
MTSNHRQPPAWLEQARNDPAAVFAEPEDVARNDALTTDEKVEVLRAWELEALELAEAETEGMPGSANGLLQRILATLTELTGGSGKGGPASG